MKDERLRLEQGSTVADRPFILHPSSFILSELKYLLFLAVGPLLLFGRLLATGRALYYRDIALDFEPQTAFIMAALRDGEFPFWNPLSAAGYPQLAGMQPPYFYPPSILFYYLDYPRALAIYLLLHFLLAGWGVYALGRWWSWGRPAAALAGLLFMLGGSFVSLVEFYTSVPPAALLPWVVLAFDRALYRATPGSAVAAALVYGLQVSNGRPDISLMSTLFLAAYAGFKAFGPVAPVRGRAGTLRLLAVTIGGGVLLNAAMLVPTLELLRHSTRLMGIRLEESGAHAFTTFHLLTLLVPGFFGDPEWGGDWGRFLLGEPYQRYSQLYLSVYPGVAAWVLVYAAWRRRGPLFWLLAVVALLAALLALGNRTPLFGYLHLLPLFQWTRHAVKYFFLASWCWTLAAGLGCEWLLRRPQAGVGLARGGLLASLAAGALLALAAWQADAAAARLAAVDWTGWVPYDPTGFATPGQINAYMAQAVRDSYWPTWRRCLQAWLLLTACCFVVSLWATRVLGRRTFVALLLLLALGDLLAANGRLLYSADPALFTFRPAAIDFLTDEGGRMKDESLRVAEGPGLAGRLLHPSFRILPVPGPAQLAGPNLAYLLAHDPGRSLQEKLHLQSRELLDNNVALHFGIATASQYASLVPFRSPHYLWQALRAIRLPAQRRHVPPERLAALEGVMAVRYRVTARAAGTPPDPPPGYEHAWSHPLASNPGLLATVYRNRRYVPRAHFVTSARVVPSLGTAAYRMVRQDWDFRQWVLLEQDEALAETMRLRERARRREPGAARSCRIVESRANRVTVVNESPESGFLVLADNAYPGWRVAVDGEERPLLRANAVFRAVYLEAGRHTVTFRYHPTVFYQGLLLSLAAAAGLAVYAGRRRRPWFPLLG